MKIDVFLIKTTRIILLISVLQSCGMPAQTANTNHNYTLSGVTKPGNFAIERIELQFANGRAERSVTRQQLLHPMAQIQYQGQGVFQANWTIDGQPIQSVNINVFKGNRLKLKPPTAIAIQSLTAGYHVLGLIITQPQTKVTKANIRFFIKD